MSCHNIGHGINTITELLIEQYRKGEISKEAYRALLIRCGRAVNYCDGNDYEALEALSSAGICGFCLEENNQLLDNTRDIYPGDTVKLGNIQEKVVYGHLCSECAKLFLER